jgi:prolyl-tRNA synthetase
VDERDGMNPGFKFHDWELLGVPLRIELGPRDLAQGSVVTVQRPDRAKSVVPGAELEAQVERQLAEVQRKLLDASRRRRDAATGPVDGYDAFKARVEDPGGFLLAHWCGRAECEERIQEETKATIRCLAFDQPAEAGQCIRCDGESARRVHFAKAY